MNLKYDFPIEVRNLFIGVWTCWECDQNGQGRGGLALHHIWGRISSSALNASVLCTFCHEKVTGSQEERVRYFVRTYRHLINLGQSGLFQWGSSEDNFIGLVIDDLQDILSTLT